MFVLVSYDIEEDEVRKRVASVLEDYGQRVQYSVFECRLSPLLFGELRRDLEAITLGRRGSIRHYFLCASCEGKTLVEGRAR